MIIRPSDILSSSESGGWDGTSDDDRSGRANPNLESSMDWAEHQRIVFEAGKLLPIGEIPFTVAPNRDGRDAFSRLQAAYHETGSRSVLKVSKGIHQPLTNPHLQLRLETSFGGGGGTPIQTAVNTFHLDVSAIDSTDLDDRFQWKGVQFSVVVGSKTYSWPESATRQFKQNSLTRRNSISANDLNDHLQAVAAAKALAEAEALAALETARLKTFAASHGIVGSNVGGFLKGRGVPGTDGQYQYNKEKDLKIRFKAKGDSYFTIVTPQ
jgi:hypothetical protein